MTAGPEACLEHRAPSVGACVRCNRVVCGQCDVTEGCCSRCRFGLAEVPNRPFSSMNKWLLATIAFIGGSLLSCWLGVEAVGAFFRTGWH